MAIYAYLQTTVQDPDAKSAQEKLLKLSWEQNWTIVSTYIENDSSATPRCTGLFRLLLDCKPGDIVLIDQIDRLTHLNVVDWDHLRAVINDRDVLIVSSDIPTSWISISTDRDQIQRQIAQAVNDTMLDVLATIARTVGESRRWFQRRGIETAKAAGGYRGRPENTGRNDEIMAMLRGGKTWESIRNKVRCSNSTIARMSKRIKSRQADV